MLTRAWMGPVSPDWTIRVGRGEPAAAFDPAWAEADDRTLVDALSRRPPRGLRCRRRASPPSGLSAVLPLRRQPRGRGRSRAGCVHPRLQGPEGLQRGVEPRDLALSDRGQRLPQSAGAQDTEERASRACRAGRSRRCPRRTARRRAPARRARRRGARGHPAVAAEAARDARSCGYIMTCRTRRLPAILGSSVGAAKANLFHALANLKKLLR